MSDDADDDPAPQPARRGRFISDAAREASRVAREAKRAQPDPFGVPEVFVVGVGGKAFAWELRRFGGVLLQRGPETFPDAMPAREAGGAGPGRASRHAGAADVQTRQAPGVSARPRHRGTGEDDPSTPLGQTAVAILVWLDQYGPATASDVGRACGIVANSVRGRLSILQHQGFVSNCLNDDKPSQRVYAVTAEGRRRAGIGEAMEDAPATESTTPE